MTNNPFDNPTAIRTSVRVHKEDLVKLLAAMTQTWQWMKSYDIWVMGNEVSWTTVTTMNHAQRDADNAVKAARTTGVTIRRLDLGDLR